MGFCTYTKYIRGVERPRLTVCGLQVSSGWTFRVVMPQFYQGGDGQMIENSVSVSR